MLSAVRYSTHEGRRHTPGVPLSPFVEWRRYFIVSPPGDGGGSCLGGRRERLPFLLKTQKGAKGFRWIALSASRFLRPIRPGGGGLNAKKRKKEKEYIYMYASWNLKSYADPHILRREAQKWRHGVNEL